MNNDELEIERRRPLWDALSDLFLDTETRWDMPYCARACVASGYDDETLNRIFWCEVFPAAIDNLLTVAGEWANLKLGDLPLSQPGDITHTPLRQAHGAMVEDLWEGTLELTRWLREYPEAERPRHVDAWNWFSQMLFQPVPEESWALRFKMLRGALREEWPRYEGLARRLTTDSVEFADSASKIRALLEGEPSLAMTNS